MRKEEKHSYCDRCGNEMPLETLNGVIILKGSVIRGNGKSSPGATKEALLDGDFCSIVCFQAEFREKAESVGLK